MIQLQGDGQSALGASPKMFGKDIPTIQPDIVGAMSVANATNVAKPFMDMQQAIVDARIKQEALAQQKMQSERSLALQEAKMNQDQSQFDQSMIFDQQKLEQQAQQAQISQKINMERLTLDKVKQDMEMSDWTDKKVATDLLQQNSTLVSEVWSNPDKYDQETVGKIKSALLVADPKSFMSFNIEQFKEINKANISQKEASSLAATIPLMAEATAKSVELVRAGKSPTEAMAPIVTTLQKATADGVISVDVAKSMLAMSSEGVKETMKQYKKLNNSQDRSYTSYIDGKPVDQATAAKFPDKVTQFNAQTNQMTTRPTVKKQSALMEFLNSDKKGK